DGNVLPSDEATEEALSKSGAISHERVVTKRGSALFGAIQLSRPHRGRFAQCRTAIAVDNKTRPTTAVMASLFTKLNIKDRSATRRHGLAAKAGAGFIASATAN